MLASLLRRSHTTRHCAHHQFQIFFTFFKKEKGGVGGIVK